MARVRPASVWQPRHGEIRLLADRAIPRLKRGFRDALKAGRKRMDRKLARELMFTGRLDELLATVDWKHVFETLKVPLAELGGVWIDAGHIGARQITRRLKRSGRRLVYRRKRQPRRMGGVNGAGANMPVGGESPAPQIIKAIDDAFNFDRFDPTTQALIREYQDELIAELNVASRDVIEAVILAALREGKSAEETVAMIRSVIGLTASQAQAVLRFREELETRDAAALRRALLTGEDAAAAEALILEEEALIAAEEEAALIDALVERYAERYLDYRAQTIAQTEATRASALGLQDSYRQSVDSGALPEEAITQQWQVALDERVCPICLAIADMNPDGVGLNEPFQGPDGPVDSPPVHVNCRCSIEMVTNLDMVPDDEEAT